MRAHLEKLFSSKILSSEEVKKNESETLNVPVFQVGYHEHGGLVGSRLELHKSLEKQRSRRRKNVLITITHSFYGKTQEKPWHLSDTTQIYARMMKKIMKYS